LDILLSVTEYRMFFDLVKDQNKRRYLASMMKGFGSMMAAQK
jgi:hypothetical protein